MHPILFEIGPITIYMFGVMVATGFLVGGSWIAATAEKAGFDRQQIWNLNLLVLGSVLVGGRLMYFIVELFRTDYYFKNPLEIFKIWQGGLVFYGGFILTFLTVVWYGQRHRFPMLRLCDIYAAGGFLGEAFGRWGCFFMGDDYGKPASGLPWAVVFTDERSAVPTNLRGVPLHPTQLYLSALALSIFLVGRWLWRRKGRFDGQVTAAALMMYATGRSIVELFRGDADRGFVLSSPFHLSTSQFISIWGFGLGVFIWCWGHKRPPLEWPPKPAAAAAVPPDAAAAAVAGATVSAAAAPAGKEVGGSGAGEPAKAESA
jgi:phosphatidylglycerol:prolipoprotein diacylglycerol transferase